MIVTSNKPFGRWGEVFGDPVVAAAMIDRLVRARANLDVKPPVSPDRSAISASIPARA